MSGTASAMAIFDALNASGLGELVKDAIGKTKDSKMSKLKATLHLISIVVDSMDDEGKCDGKKIIKELLDKKHLIEVNSDEDLF